MSIGRWRTLPGVALALVLALAGTARAEPVDDDESNVVVLDDVGNFAESVPRDKRVVMFADSVGLGARTQLPAAFPPDWHVVVEGQPARFVEQMEEQFVRPRLATHPEWFGDHVVIAAAYNAPHWDWERLDRSIDSIVATLTGAGVKHVYWVTLREVKPEYVSDGAWRQIQPYYWYFPTVNERLRAALDRNPTLTLVDWAAHADQPGLTYDAIHLNTTGATLYSSLIRQAVGNAATRVPDGSTTRVSVPGGADAAAAVVNLTTVGPRHAGHLTVHRCSDDPPTASVHNFVRDQVVAHAAIAPLDDDGQFCITTATATNLVVDVTGLLMPGQGFTAVTPTRWVDTRRQSIVRGGDTLELDFDSVRRPSGVSTTPRAVATIVTAVGAHGLGHITVAPCGIDADHSNVNFVGADATPNLVFVEPDDAGRICLFSPTTTHMIVDLMGVFDDSADVAVGAPRRIYDSRPTGGVGPGELVRVDVSDVLSDGAQGAILNVTGLLAEAPGHFTAYPCADGLPDSSSLNLTPGIVVANAVVVAPDDRGEICVRSHSSAHMVIDVLGEVGDALDGFTPRRVLDTRR